VDNHREVITAIKNNAATLGAENVEVILGDCPDHVPPLAFAPYDLVFLDPPFHQNLLASSAEWLEQSGFFNKNAYVYVEAEKGSDMSMLPSNWLIEKDAKTASLMYYLLSRAS